MSDYTVLIPDSVPDVGIVIGKGGRNLSLIAGQDGAVKIIPRCDAKPRKVSSYIRTALIEILSSTSLPSANS